jgi:uncharacterized protein DUF4430
MSAARRLVPALLALAAALLAAFALAGCGLGAGDAQDEEARIIATADFGTRQVGGAILQDVPESETVMRATERSFDVETRYGGGFVQSIDGLAGGREDGRPVDWFLFVNGKLSDEGAARVDLYGGDRIWWDRHDWGATADTSAVVGSFPAPFTSGKEGKRFPVVLQCADDADEACDVASEQLRAAGVKASRQTLGTNVETEVVRVLVGTWSRIHADPALHQLDQGLGVGGVYARFGDDGRALDLLDPRGKVARRLGAGAGLVAATAYEEQAPAWAITGTDAAGVRAAAQALDEQRLRNRYALAIDGARDIGVPVVAR